jgi:hypothetical protein
MTAGIRILREIPWSELEERVRGVPLLEKGEDGAEIFPYENAKISLRRVSTAELCCPSRYALKGNLEEQRRLHHFLRDYGLDSLSLSSALELSDGSDRVWSLLPPVVEVFNQEVIFPPRAGEIDHTGRSSVIPIQMLIDGVHRVLLAREIGAEINVLHITGVNERFPYYALPNSWEELRILDELPATAQEKKLYRRENCYGLFRNFDLLGCGAPRGVKQS